MTSITTHPQPNSVQLVWLRRDLRLDDHRAFYHAFSTNHHILPVFILDEDILVHFPDPNDPRLTFLIATLQTINQQIKAQNPNSGLLVYKGSAKQLIPELTAHFPQIIGLSAARDVEPSAQLRDQYVTQKLQQQKRTTHWLWDHLLSPPDIINKPDGQPYKVFTPFAKKLHEWLAQSQSRTRLENLTSEQYQRFAPMEPFTHLANKAPNIHCLWINLDQSISQILHPIGYKETAHCALQPDRALTKLYDFVDHHLDHYHASRDFLHGPNNTSQLSPYLRFGLISPRQCLHSISMHLAQGNLGAKSWLNELIWRDFYAHILYHFPESATEEWNPRYRHLPWHQQQEWVERWQEGRTGVPIIDAAMRQLRQHYWMPNRARMIVASYFTKDLLLDWRIGEQHFKRYLIDYELASNVGGWQWCASVGTDAQPYFRVFNPYLQAAKFDPNGDYIRSHIPELISLQGAAIIDPEKLPPLLRQTLPYPKPMIARNGTIDRVKKFFNSNQNTH
jgi:deoxyribodipyrimidine photo-lyase